MRLTQLIAIALCAAALLPALAVEPPAKDPPKNNKSGGKAGKTEDGTEPKTPSKKTKPKQPGAELRICKLRLSWWTPPEKTPELAMLMDRGAVPVIPESGTISNIIDYEGEPGAILAYRGPTGEIDKKGQPIIGWLPLATIPIGANDTDLAIILFLSEKGVAFKKFDFSQAAFPFGSLHVANFTNSKVLATLNDAVFSAAPGGIAACPKVTSARTVTHFAVAAIESETSQHMIDSSTVIMYPSFRVLYFVYEIPGKEPNERFHTKNIMDAMPIEIPKVPAFIPATPPEGKASPTAQPKANDGKVGAKSDVK